MHLKAGPSYIQPCESVRPQFDHTVLLSSYPLRRSQLEDLLARPSHLEIDLLIHVPNHLLFDAVAALFLLCGLVVAKDEVHLLESTASRLRNEEPNPHQSNQTKCSEKDVGSEAETGDHGWSDETLTYVSIQ